MASGGVKGIDLTAGPLQVPPSNYRPGLSYIIPWAWWSPIQAVYRNEPFYESNYKLLLWFLIIIIIIIILIKIIIIKKPWDAVKNCSETFMFC